MSILGRKIPVAVVAAIAAIMIVAALLPVWSKTPAREITLVARGMAFYLEGDLTQPNPVITVKAGEPVRVVLRNEERGMTHAFAVPAFGAATGLLHWNERGEVLFDVPEKAGTYEYVCGPHMLMMKGTLKVY
jgi:plastocyanin